MASVARHLIIRGNVQGVGYRDAMRQEALRVGVRGWVRNRRDGTVEAVIEGTEAAVALILRWAHRGPEPANVARVEITEDFRTYTSFEMLPTE